MRKPLLSLQEFRAAHRKHENKLNRYMLTPRGSKIITDEIFDDIRKAAARSLKATNATARIALAERAYAIFRDRTDKFDETYSFVTLTPKMFSAPVDETHEEYWQALKTWTERHLRGLHYLGIVDAAYFSNYVPRSSNRPVPTISWHIHALTWGTEPGKLNALAEGINAKFESLVPGRNVADVMSPKTTKTILARVPYILKMPLSEYRLIPLRNPAVEFDIKKRELRPGDSAKLCRVLLGTSIPDLCVYGGEGRALFRQLMDDTTRQLERAEKRRLRALEQALGL